MEDFMQSLDDHIAVSPNPAQNPLPGPSEWEPDSGLEEPLTYEQ